MQQTRAKLPIGDMLAQVDGWHDQSQRGIPETESGSDLDGDRLEGPDYTVSDLARTGCGSALDHLSAFSHLVQHTGVLHPLTPFTILRSAIENASQAIWVLAPDDRMQRITHVLKLAHENARQQAAAIMLLPDKDSEANQKRRQRTAKICAEAKRLGISEQTVSAKLEMRRIVADVGGQMFPNRGHRAAVNELIWRSCSGMAHGRKWAMMTLLSVEVPATAKPGDQIPIHSDDENLTSVFDCGYQLTGRALGLYERRRQAAA
jgi:hypothetical protein